MAEQNKPILQVKNLTKIYRVPATKIFEKKRTFIALNDASFDVHYGETVGLIGESGCGKSTTGRIIVKLLQATSGEVIYEGRDINKMSRAEFKKERTDIQMIFQDPATALNPQFTIGGLMREALRSVGITSKEEQDKKILPLIAHAGLTEEYLARAPHELSGGQKQRICILLALLLDPKFIVADEVVSALDLSVQAQILNMIRRIQREMNLSMIFISHDLNIIHYVSDRIIVMYMGEIVEQGTCEEIYRKGLHPYTHLLLSSLITLNADNTQGEAKDMGEIVRSEKVCIFAPRCPKATDQCWNEKPSLKEVEPGHLVKCHFVQTMEEAAAGIREQTN